MQVCNKCKIKKPFEDYHISKLNKYGYDYKCKACKSKLRTIIRKQVIEYYGNKCECCGENKYEFLALDHINGGGNQHRKETGTDTMLWIVRNEFPEGFRILCHNCNVSYGLYGFCPHQSK